VREVYARTTGEAPALMLSGLSVCLAEVRATVYLSLKMLLFTTIMPLRSILSIITYALCAYPLVVGSIDPSHDLHSSFVIIKFGGVISMSSAGFVELKWVFYLALDASNADVEASETFARASSLHGLVHVDVTPQHVH
jgi:hypothetical protein